MESITVEIMAARNVTNPCALPMVTAQARTKNNNGVLVMSDVPLERFCNDNMSKPEIEALGEAAKNAVITFLLKNSQK